MKTGFFFKTIIIVSFSVFLLACNDSEALPVETKSNQTAQTEQTTETSPTAEYELFSLSPSDYSYIITANGKTGERIRWDDAESIQNIVDKINGYRYTQVIEGDLEGWTAGINFYSAEDEELLRIVVGPIEIRYNHVCYLRPASDGEEYFDAEFLLQYFNYQ